MPKALARDLHILAIVRRDVPFLFFCFYLTASLRAAFLLSTCIKQCIHRWIEAASLHSFAVAITILSFLDFYSAMTRVVSASAEETFHYTKRTFPIYDGSKAPLSHAASCIELRGTGLHGCPAPFSRQRRGLQQARKAASSFPLSEVSDNVTRSSSSNGLCCTKTSSQSFGHSDNEQYALRTPESSSSSAKRAYPTPPASEEDDVDDPAYLGADSDNSIDSLPFPLDPVPLPPLRSPAIFNKEPPQTPSPKRQNPLTPVAMPASSPDRYVSNRNSPQERIQIFRTGRLPNQLSPSERLLRHNTASPDPFGPLVLPRLRNLGPTPEISSPGSPIGRAPRPIGTTNVVSLPGSPLSAQNRQASAGAVWNVGGLALSQHQGPIRSVSDGRGGFISGGSNAPMYTSRFFDKDTSDQDFKLMEARLAAALDIDQTRKVLDISRSPISPRVASTGGIGSKRKLPYVEPGTKWLHGEWNRAGSRSREFT